jgi:Ala-tRNA(Pro) deacylase
MPVETVVSHLEERGIAYEVVEHDRALTAAAEARAAGQEPANAVKSVLLRDLDGYELVVLQASDRLDLRKVREQLGEKRSELRFATEVEMDADFPQF